MGRGQFGGRGHHVARKATVFALIQAWAQVGAERGCHQFFARDARQVLRIAQRAEPVQHFGRLPCGARQIGGFGCGGDRRHGKAFQHFNEQAGQRQVGPFGVRGDVDQHDLALAHALAGDQRCAIGQLRNHAGCQRRIRLGHDLRCDRDVLGNVQTKERAIGVKGRECFGLAPAHRAADGAATGAQADRHQRVFFAAGHVACGKAGTGKAQQHTALFQPFQQQRLFAFADGRDVGKDDNIGIGWQHIRQAAFNQIGSGFQSAFQIVGGRQQF